MDLIESAATQSSNLISEFSAHQFLPNFNELQNLKKDNHIILYFCDLWGYISANINDPNVKSFVGFLLSSRREHISLIFEFHTFPWGLKKEVNDLFRLYLSNSTLIFLTKTISDQSKLNLFKKRFLNKTDIETFEKAQQMAQHIVDKVNDGNNRSYVCYQKDIRQKHRLIRVDVFNENVISILDS